MPSFRLPIVPDQSVLLSIDASNPYASRKSHFDARAKQVLVIYCPGAVSHVDTFDYKPKLRGMEGKTVDVDCAVGEVPCLTADDDHGFVIDEAEVQRQAAADGGAAVEGVGK